MLTLPDIIRKKRDGEELSDSEMKHFLRTTTDGTAQDCQIGAMLMAMFLKGLSKKEMISLTTSMVESGYKVNLSISEMQAALESAGCFIAGATGSLAPADKELYKRRDVTATVDSTPLIVGSIISKKAAEGTKFLVMDIKVGVAAFYKNLESAKVLAENMIEVAAGLGVKCQVVLSRMDTPIGKTVGNALEVAESIECLKGKGPSDLNDLVTTLGGLLLESCGKSSNLDEGKKAIWQALTNGSALSCFEQMLVCQGVSHAVAKELCHGNAQSILPTVDKVELLKVPCDGFIVSIDAMAVGRISWSLGAGRSKADQPVDYAVGVRLLCVEGERVLSGQPWCEVHYRGQALDTQLRRQLEDSFVIKNSLLGDRPMSRILHIM